MSIRKLDVPTKGIAILVKGWDEDHKLFRIILVQGRTVRNFIWDFTKFPDKARMTVGGRGMLSVPNTVNNGVLGVMVAERIKAFKAEECPRVKKAETFMTHLADKWLPLVI